MGRYFFNLHDQTGLLRDEEGRVFDCLERVQEAALQDARAIICAEAQTGVLDLRSRIEVFDEESHHVLTLRFREAVEVKS